MASIEHRQSKSGEVWRVRYRDGRRQPVVTFTDPERAEAWRRLVEVDRDAALRALDGTPEPVAVESVAAVIASHIDGLTGVTGGTRAEYRAYLARDIEPHAVGSLPITSVDRQAISGWVQWLASRGLAGKTIANRHGLMSAAMSTAVDRGLITANPCRGMRLPRTSHREREMVFLTDEEFARLYALLPGRWKPLVLMLVGTGMRFGEVTALRVGDVDADARSARITRAWKRTRKAAPELGPTKTKRSDRTVALPPQVVESIRPLLDRPAEALLFTNTRGGEVRQAPFWNRVWAPAVRQFAGDELAVGHDAGGRPVVTVVKRGEGKHPRVHDLRHTFASWAIQKGYSLPVIQRQLGHESITTTIDTYGHLARADFDALASAIATMLPPTLGAGHDESAPALP